MKRILPFLFCLLFPVWALAQVQVNVTDTYFNSSTGRIAGRTTAGPGTASELTADQAIGVVGGGTGGFGFRNRLKNADIRIDQPNAGNSVSVSTAAVTDSVDQWWGFGTASAGVFTLVQSTSTPPAGYTNFLRCTVTTADASPAAGANYYFVNSIEGQEIPDFQLGVATAKTVTLSFLARSSLTGTFSGALTNSASNRSYPFSYNIGSANTWTTETVTIVLDTTGTWLTTAGVGLRVIFDMGSGSTARGTAGSWSGSTFVGVTSSVRVISTNAATFDLTAVQLELGSLATTFEMVDWTTELNRLQRYYAKSFLIATKPAQGIGANTGETTFIAGRAGVTTDTWEIILPVQMRTTATITTYNPVNGNAQAFDSDAGSDCSAASTFAKSPRAFNFATSGAAGTTIGNNLRIHWSADARLH